MKYLDQMMGSTGKVKAKGTFCRLSLEEKPKPNMLNTIFSFGCQTVLILYYKYLIPHFELIFY